MTALPFIMAASQVVQGIGEYQQGRAQQKAYNRQAEAEAVASEFEIQQTKEQQGRDFGSQLARIGISGTGLSGSPLDAIGRTAEQQETDILAQRYSSSVKQSGLRHMGKVAKYEGTQKLFGRILQGGSTILGSQTSGDSSRYQYDPATTPPPRKPVRYGGY